MVTLTFKATEEEARKIRQQARREKLSLSEYLRRRASAPASSPLSVPRLVRCPHTGAMIYARLDDRPPLTTESVRQLLGDFP
jgi:hypothetical protein